MPGELNEKEIKKCNVLRLSNKESNEFTKECIRTAFLILIFQKPIEKITITELVSKAGVSRTAFYRNYETKKDIANEIISDILNDIEASIRNPKYNNNDYEWYFDLFTAFSQIDGQLLNALKGEGAMFLMLSGNPLFSMFLKPKTTEEFYMYTAWECSIKNLLIEWIKNDMKETPQQMADICCKIFK